jgi:P-type Cu+ transporter
MKYLLTLTLALVITTGMAHAQHGDKAKSTSTEKASLICPVTGEDADPEVSYTYEGKTYYFCCNGCVTKFKKEPTKYIKASSTGKFAPCDHPEEGKEALKTDGRPEAEKVYTVTATDTEQAVINEGKDLSAQIANKICPVMGKAVDKKVTTVTYKDKVYGFCCKSCIKKFAANPEKYLKAE